MKKIIVLGAGYAGVLTAKKLHKRLKAYKDQVSITLINKTPFHTMLTELHEVAACRVEEDNILIPLKKIFAGRNVALCVDTIESIDFERKTLLGEKSSYAYDYLVIATGSVPSYYGVPGAEEFSYKLWSFEDAVRLKERFLNCFRMAASEEDIETKRVLLRFYVVGASFTGVEMAGELAELASILCKRYSIDPALVDIHCVDVLPQVTPALPDKLCKKIVRRLKKTGVVVELETAVAGIEENKIILKKKDDVVEADAGTVIWTAGIQGAPVARQAAGTLKGTKNGRIETNAYLQAGGREDVYVAGDNIFYIAEGEDRPVAQMVETAEQNSGVVARNITAQVTGAGQMERYIPKYHGAMVSVGGRYGVANIGTVGHKINLPSFLAMFVKHFINVVYFVQILGWNKVFSYLRHEFFTIRNNRSFLGGHFSNKTPSFLLFPLRVWLGLVWVYEGVVKMMEGWLSSPKLSEFFGGAKAWYDNIVAGADAVTRPTGPVYSVATQAVDAVAAATGGAADAVTAATGAGGAAASLGQVFLNWDWGWLKFLFVSGKEFTQSSLGDMAVKFDMPAMDSFIANSILPSGSAQIGMQTLIVVMEIVIGVLLVLGLFTTVSSGASLVLQGMFVLTTGLYLNTLWMVFAAIALLFGGGRVLGLDYYVMPALAKKWRSISWVKKSYLYND